MPQNIITPTQTAQVSRLNLSVESVRSGADTSNVYGSGPFNCSCFAEE